jgi:GntR family transcriptional repressor for pyruvate dehydrogenase complex
VSYRPEPPTAGARAAIGDRSEHLRDMLVFRRLVEPGACYVAANRELTQEQRVFLAAAHAEVAGAGDRETHRQADSRFHLAIATVTGSPLTIRAVTGAQADLHDMLTAIPVLDVNIEHSDKQHRTILNAILKGEATKARRVMENHCDDTAALLRGLLT